MSARSIAGAGGLVMAGGDGTRMRATGGPDLPKALAMVRGAALLERNLCALLGAGLRRLWVACRAEQREIRAEVARLAALVDPRGVKLEALVEPTPLGTIGAAGLLRGRVDALVTVNADNLTALDLGRLFERHRGTGADLTLASHVHPWRLDYGELRVDGDRVTEYLEKPVRLTRVCSAVCVLGAEAMAVLDGRAGLPELCRRVLAGGGDVRAFEHAAAWIDVNDAGDLRRAEALVAANPDPLECWCPDPDVEVAGAILCDGDRVLLDRRARGTGDPLWDTPGGKVEPGEAPAAALARELDEELGVRVLSPGAELARFDAIEPAGRVLRHHVFALSVRRGEPRAREGQPLEWFARASLPDGRSPVVSRSLACLELAGGAPSGEARADR